MKSMKPSAVLIVGLLLLALAFAAVAASVQRDFRSPREITIALASGLILGLFIFAPVAAGARRSTFVRRHFQQFERWSALLLAMGVGHWVGLLLGDAGISVAIVLVFVCACFRVCLHELTKQWVA